MLFAPPHHPATASMSPGRRLHASRPPLQSAHHRSPSGLPTPLLLVLCSSADRLHPHRQPHPTPTPPDILASQHHHESLLRSGSQDRWPDYTGRSPPPHALVPYDLIAGDGHPLLLCVEMVSVASVLEAMGLRNGGSWLTWFALNHLLCSELLRVMYQVVA
ncbi:hypothetical protein GUJ93_ZPchr0001g32162 [Zizania palustris]|uniref:Uncharacterized protein n=1 Tax=Zizania palustris TaxID=103762 RepID=A0A8J5RTL8_ZIZPA|nr:hypothetical protein GUJ93_ZPchr0001g32162 [Zizania palustris]